MTELDGNLQGQLVLPISVFSLPTLSPAPLGLRITGLSFPCQLPYLGDKEIWRGKDMRTLGSQTTLPAISSHQSLCGCPEKAVSIQGPSCLSLKSCASWAERGRSQPWGWAHHSGCPTEPVGNLPKGGTLPSSPSRIW